MILEGMRTLFTLNLRHATRVLGLRHLEVHNRSVPNLKLHEAYHIYLDSKSLGVSTGMNLIRLERSPEPEPEP